MEDVDGDFFLDQFVFGFEAADPEISAGLRALNKSGKSV